MKESSLRPALAAMVLLLLLPVLYLGSYWAVLMPAWTIDLENPVVYVRQPEYRFGGVVADKVFHPANILDRQIRPDYWTEVMVYDFGSRQ